MLHCRFFIDFPRQAICLLDCPRRILYPLWEDVSGCHLRQLFYLTQAEFVVCDYTIENRLHWRRDVTMGEDHCQVRKGCAPRTLAVLNSFLLAVFDWLGVSNVASQMRTFSASPHLALRLLVGSLVPSIK